MSSVLIKGVEISPQPSSEFSDRVVGVEVNMLVLDRSPKPFDKHVVHPPAFTIHADLNAVGLRDAGKGIACELTALTYYQLSTCLKKPVQLSHRI